MMMIMMMIRENESWGFAISKQQQSCNVGRQETAANGRGLESENIGYCQIDGSEIDTSREGYFIAIAPQQNRATRLRRHELDNI